MPIMHAHRMHLRLPDVCRGEQEQARTVRLLLVCGASSASTRTGEAMTAPRCPTCDRADCEWMASDHLDLADGKECMRHRVDWRARALAAEALVVEAFDIGYDAGWDATGEGKNGEYTSARYTAEKYEAERGAARDSFLRLRGVKRAT